MLQHYFDNFIMRFTVADYTTAWQRLEVGIVTGCTISVVLFSAAMNMLVKSAEKMSRGPVMSSGVSQPPTRAFMDDMTITAKSVLEGKWMLQDLGELVQAFKVKESDIKERKEEFKVTKTRQVIMLRDSKDDKVKEANVDVRTGRKWVAKSAVEDAESRLRHSGSGNIRATWFWQHSATIMAVSRCKT
ncbi:unnamed protein product [Mytilus coruscus]|uniref:Reverse transcriptase domain-containing protein n=1 Tax=Mytilus coruscus TaxID=42192 RepID=A0A6J8BN85_MYTCO|nr:unnamed protein product [Mytilus coruscus]